ncbi:alpha/beta hydrolase family protein [Gordonia soli]|uniref:BD-FAE-like domain-containing protein n=1 Tax=Gordonia soli NBRC 108243 TaxID=1223545 RepID=M0QL82_9ACTN|nr:alpha/beta hydrolase [Gordonia soli]GAC69385.1 hypothetical protein GS4_24_00310 [Gordonia soli NBRC 108243]
MSGRVHRVKVHYGSAPSQFGHVYHPVDDEGGSDPTGGGETVPLIVLVHGGYWTTEFALTIETAIARLLAARGCVVWNIEYRRVGEPGGGWPSTGRDVVAAIRALDGPVPDALPSPIAERLARRSVVVIGHSAGGQLAVWATARLGARTDTCTITTVVAQSAPLDLADPDAGDRPSLVGLLGGRRADVPDRYRDASPAHQPAFPARVVAVHAGEDRAVPVEASRRFVRAAAARGQDAELLVVPGEGHDAFVDPHSQCTRQTIRLLGV